MVSPIPVTGLTNGVSYTFTVKATKTAGTGPASAASNAVIPIAGQTITFANPGTQTYGTSPTLAATASSGLTVSFSSSATTVCTITSGGVLTFVAAGTCTIDADQAGDASWSAAPRVWQSFLVNAVPPTAPSLGPLPPGDGQINVAFCAPTNPGGTTITNYEYSTDGGTNWVSAGTTNSAITITGLTNGTTYTVALRAVNSMGAGAASQTGTATPVALPGAPTLGTLTPGDGEITVTFTPPDNTGGAAITDYDFSLDGGTTWTSAGTTSTTITISGLTNGTTYTVALRAVTSVGAGPASQTGTAMPVTIPDAPVI